MEIHYSDGWFRAHKEPGELWAAERAKKAFDRRKSHAVIAGPLEKPAAFIEFNMDYVGVGFLDGRLREYLSYTFAEVEPDRLFLTMATHREYEGDSDRVKKGRTYYFKQDGKVVVETQEIPGGVTQHETTADVSGNWESYPTFGQYDSLLRINR